MSLLRAVPIAVLLWSLAAVAATAQDTTGVAVCDRFFVKYQACVQTRPEPERQALEKAMNLMRNMMRGRLARGDARSALEADCTRFDADMKVQAAQLKCAW